MTNGQTTRPAELLLVSGTAEPEPFSSQLRAAGYRVFDVPNIEHAIEVLADRNTIRAVVIADTRRNSSRQQRDETARRIAAVRTLPACFLVTGPSQATSEAEDTPTAKTDGRHQPPAAGAPAMAETDQSGLLDALDGALRLFGQQQSAAPRQGTGQLDLQSSDVEAGASQPDYRAILDAMNDTAWVIDLEGRFVEVNQAATRALGYSRAELLCMGPEDIDAAIGTAEIRALIRSMPADGVQRFETRHRRKDGSEVAVEISSSLVCRDGLPAILSVARDITERKEAELSVKAHLHEKDTLLKELNHRVRNNMTIIASLLTLQGNNTTDAATISALREAASRIQAMQLLHEKMSMAHAAAHTDLADYLDPLIDGVMALFPSSTPVTVEKQLEHVALGSRRVSSLGLIVNELLTNVMKHAFRGRTRGRVRITAGTDGGRLILEVTDDGVGSAAMIEPPAGAVGSAVAGGATSGSAPADDLPAPTLELGRETDSPETVQTGLGLSLVQLLAEQLGGSVTMTSDNGTQTRIVVPLG